MRLDVIPKGVNVERGKRTKDEPEGPPTFGGQLVERRTRREAEK